MKIIFSLSVLLACVCSLYAQSVQTGGSLYISFNIPPSPGEDALEYYNSQSSKFAGLSEKYSLVLESPFVKQEKMLQRLSENSIRLNGNDDAVSVLRRLFRIRLSVTEESELKLLASELAACDIVRYCEFMSAEPVPPPFDIPPATDNYEHLQGYIGPDPGVDMQYAWDQGLFGQGVNVRDVEYGVNIAHEDFNEQKTFIAEGMSIDYNLPVSYFEHGTAAVGILQAHQGDYGSTGLVHKVNEVILFPENTIENDYDRIAAITEAIAKSDEGDVIMYELQSLGTSGYVPAEYAWPVWDLTKAATDAGIIIVAAAGNGNQNLDSSDYFEYMQRGHSGAIIVGAGTSDVKHNRLPFSTYGSRVDLQAWGYNVFSPGYGNAFKVGNDFNQQYTYFSGTSSATPIVTACVINMLTLYRQLTGRVMTIKELRNILVDTGVPQGTGAFGNIGPLPNMKAAIEYLNARVLSTEQPEGFNFTVYPNPAKSDLTFLLGNTEKLNLSMTDATGRIVLEQEVAGTSKLDVKAYERGIYFITLSSGERKVTQRVVLL